MEQNAKHPEQKVKAALCSTILFLVLISINATAIDVNITETISTVDNGTHLNILFNSNITHSINKNASLNSSFNLTFNTTVDETIINITQIVNESIQTINLTVNNCSLTNDDITSLIENKLSNIQDNLRDTVLTVRDECTDELSNAHNLIAQKTEQAGECKETLTALEARVELNETQCTFDKDKLESQKDQAIKDFQALEGYTKWTLVVLAGIIFAVIIYIGNKENWFAGSGGFG